MAGENAFRSNRDSPDEGDMWRHGFPKSRIWCSAGDDWTGSESTSSFEEYEHNVESLASEVMGQNWSGEMVSLFLEDWELGRVALSCHLAMDPLCQEMRDACWVSLQLLGSPSSLRSQFQSTSLEEVSHQKCLSLSVDGL